MFTQGLEIQMVAPAWQNLTCAQFSVLDLVWPCIQGYLQVNDSLKLCDHALFVSSVSKCLGI